MGYSHVTAYGDVPPKLVNFSPKFLRQGSQLSQKILTGGSYFTKIVKSSIFEAEKLLDFAKILKKKTQKNKTIKSAIS